MSDEKTPAEVVDEAVEKDAAITAKGGIGPLSLAVAALFGLVYAYFVYQAIRNVIELPKTYSAIGLADAVPWPLLIVGLAVPIVIYVLAFVIGLRRGLLDKALVFLIGVATTAALGYGVIAIHRLTVQALFASLSN